MDKNGPGIKIDNGELATSTIPEDFTEPRVLYEKLIKMIRKYHPSDDISMIEKAYRIAYKAAVGQLRMSGEPYIIHPVCVCIILAELELDKETIVAGMLHDVVEDTVMTSEELAAEFGDEVALLVDGVTKLTQLDYVADKTVFIICVRCSTRRRRNKRKSPERLSIFMHRSQTVSEFPK